MSAGGHYSSTMSTPIPAADETPLAETTFIDSQQPVQLFDAVEWAGKAFRLVIYSQKLHGIGGSWHL